MWSVYFFFFFCKFKTKLALLWITAKFNESAALKGLTLAEQHLAIMEIRKFGKQTLLVLNVQHSSAW